MPAIEQILKIPRFEQMANESINLECTNSTIKAMAADNSTHNYDETPSNLVLDSSAIVNNNPINNSNANISTSQSNSSGRDRKGTSYVWNYCEKLSRHTVRCRLCTKVMSFHGTANIITHLQRRHNILGDNIQTSLTLPRRGPRSDEIMDANGSVAGVSGAFDPMMMTDLMEDVSEENDRLNAEKYNNSTGSSRKSINGASVVWRYCRRISKDQVRCCFCKKDLSYQGTSNLQRHLHRMHGVVTQGRHPKMNTANNNQDNDVVHTAVDEGDAVTGTNSAVAGHIYYPVIKEENIKLPNNLDFIWQFCTHHELLPKVKCNMCEVSFMTKDMLGIAKHLTMIHGVETNHLVSNTNHLHDGIELCGQTKWRHRNALDYVSLK